MFIQETQHTDRDQLSVLLAVTLLSATLFRFVELPNYDINIQHILGSPLRVRLDGNWLLTFLMMGLVASGTLTIMQNHPLRETRDRPIVFSLITPTLGAFLTSLLLIRTTSWSIWLGTLLIGGALIAVLVRVSYHAFSPANRAYPGARTMVNIFDYLLGFISLSLMLQGQERALVTAPVVFILTGLLALELLTASAGKTGIIVLFSGIIALLASELAWVLGYWPISSWTAAALLILMLYATTSIAYQYLLDRLTRQIIAEFVIVTVLMFFLVLWVRP